MPDGAGRPRQVTRGWLGKLRTMVRSEVGDLAPLAEVAQVASAALPQLRFNRVRTAAFRAAGVRIGERSLVMGRVDVTGAAHWPSLLSIGSDTYITGPIRFDLHGYVSIGSEVNIGHDCLVITVNHAVGGPERRAGLSHSSDITIGDGAWLAARTTLLPGVTIGTGAIVAAGAVVAANVEPHTMVGGVPAKLMRRLDPSARALPKIKSA